MEHLPAGSAFRVEVEGPDSVLTYQDHVNRQAVFELRVANWARGGGKGQRPEPVPLPSQVIKKQRSDASNRRAVFALRAKANRGQKQETTT